MEKNRIGVRFNVDSFVKSPKTVMPDLIRHPEVIEFTGFRLSPEWRQKRIPNFLRDRQTLVTPVKYASLFIGINFTG